MTVLRGPADADHYRVKVGRYYDRWYVDPLPADDIADVTDDSWPSVSSIKKASGSDWSFVALKRVAAELETNTKALDGLDYDTRYDRLKSINDLGLRYAGKRGTQVHTYFEKGLRGEPLAPSTLDHPDGVRYLPAVQSFLDTYQPELIAAELVCINRTLNGYGYGGTADALVRIDGRTYLPDWKSRGDDSNHGAYPDEAAQLGGYSGADYILVEGPKGPERMRLPHIDGGLIVSVKTDGVRIYPIDLDKARVHWEALHAWWGARRSEREPVGKPWAPRTPIDTIAEAVEAATSVDQLYNLFESYGSRWTDHHTSLAAARKTALTQEGAQAS